MSVEPALSTVGSPVVTPVPAPVVPVASRDAVPAQLLAISAEEEALALQRRLMDEAKQGRDALAMNAAAVHVQGGHRCVSRKSSWS